MTRSEYDLILTLCKEYTNLEQEDIQLLTHLAEKLPYYSKSKNADVFINCLCKNGEEAIVIAESIRENSLYEFSTIGYIIQQENEPAVLRSLRYGIETEEVRATTYASSEENTIIQSVFPIKRMSKIIGVIIYEYEYSNGTPYAERTPRPYPVCQNSAPDLPEYLINLEWVGACIEDALIIIDHTGCVCYRNATAQQLYYDYGFVHDILHREYRKLSLNGVILPEKKVNSVQREEIKIRDRVYMCSQYWISLSENGLGFYVVNIHDITHEKRNEAMNQLKELTLREIQHRIKNNLYTVYSLLDLKKRRLKSPEAIEVLQDTMNRIMSISSTYEEGAVSASQEPLSLLNYLVRIKDHFQSIYQTQENGVEVNVLGDVVLVDSDKAAHIALVVNELMQNSYKHAFKNSSSGLIQVEVKKTAVGNTVTVFDNGSGFNAVQMKNSAKSSMGLQMAEMIVQDKLRGKLNIVSNARGTKVWFDFK